MASRRVSDSEMPALMAFARNLRQLWYALLLGTCVSVLLLAFSLSDRSFLTAVSAIGVVVCVLGITYITYLRKRVERKVNSQRSVER